MLLILLLLLLLLLLLANLEPQMCPEPAICGSRMGMDVGARLHDAKLGLAAFIGPCRSDGIEQGTSPMEHNKLK